MKENKCLSNIIYNIIIPRLDYTAPINVAIDLAAESIKFGYKVNLYYLSDFPVRSDLSKFNIIKKFNFFDFFKINGIVHTHGLRSDLVGGLLSFKKKCITVTTLHGEYPNHISYSYPSWKVKVASLLLFIALGRFSCVVCISDSMRKHYKKILPHINYELIYNSRSLARKTQQSNENTKILQWINEKKKKKFFVLCYVGSLTTRKRILPFIKFLFNFKKTALIICGEGNLTSAVEEAIYKNNNFLYAGYIDNPSCIISKSDILVLPSYDEGFPLVILEAASVGVPALLSDIKVHREISRLGFGNTFKFGDINSFRESLQETIKTSDSLKLKDMYIKKYSSTSGFKKYDFLFKKLLSNLKNNKS